MPDNQNFTKQKTQDDFTTEKVDVVQNALLGDYNANGNYVISDEIVNELILVNKERTNSFQSSIFCTTHLDKYGDLTFEILLKKNTKLNIAVAEMYLLETVEKINGYIYNTIKTPIAKFSEEITNDFIPKALAMFHVITKKGETNDDGGKEFISEEVNLHYIETRKNFNELVHRLTADDFEKAYEKYFNKRLSLLKEQNGLFAKDVLAQFNDEYSRIESYFLVGKNGKVRYKALNELLDNALESVSGTKPALFKDEEIHKLAVSAFTSKFSKEIELHRERAFEAVISKREDLVETREQMDKAVSSPEQSVKVVKPEPGLNAASTIWSAINSFASEAKPKVVDAEEREFKPRDMEQKTAIQEQVGKETVAPTPAQKSPAPQEKQQTFVLETNANELVGRLVSDVAVQTVKGNNQEEEIIVVKNQMNQDFMPSDENNLDNGMNR